MNGIERKSPAAPPLRWDFSGRDSSSTLSRPTIVSAKQWNKGREGGSRIKGRKEGRGGEEGGKEEKV